MDIISTVDDSRKRGRDDDQEDYVFGSGPLSFRQHPTKQKRIENKPLPLRSSPMQHPAQPRSRVTPWSSSFTPSSTSAIYLSEDHEMDMTVDGYLSPGPMQPDSDPDGLASLSYNNSSTTTSDHANALLSTRVPTPIHPMFVSQVAAGQATNNMSTATLTPVDTGSIPRTMEESDWAQTRRLPSPISEADLDGEFPPGPDMLVDSQSHHNDDLPHIGENDHKIEIDCDERHMFINARAHVPPPAPPPVSTVSVISGGGMDVEDSTNSASSSSFSSSSSCSLRATTANQPPATSSNSPPAKKGHTRSRHTLSSWTCKPGMKRSFSIGYRSDCEKCRLKVPGHFNHIVIS